MRASIAALGLTLLAAPALAQERTGGFVVSLGADTVQVESFTRSARHIEGLVVTRVPRTRIVRYRLDLDAGGQPARYTQNVALPDGSRVHPSGANATLAFHGDSVIRHTWLRTDSVEQHFAAKRGTVPILGGSLILFGQSYLTYELAYAYGRRAAAAGDSTWLLVGSGGAPTQAQRQRIWLVGSDSAEADYFGQARMGFKFDARGELVRADWRQTTYKYIAQRVPSVDALGIAAAWATQEVQGKPFGAMSPLDSTAAVVQGANVAIRYSRPAARGRTVWGALVPYHQVWRLGADLATHFRTDADLRIGDAAVPAGEYTLWLIPTEAGAQLVVNKRTRIFGTQYDPAQDLARIPMRLATSEQDVERLTLEFRDHELLVQWADRSYSVPIAR